MTDIELVKSLVEEAEALEYGQHDAIRRSGEMAIRRIFGDASHYLNNMEDIDFIPSRGYINGDNERFYRDRFAYDKPRLINLFKTMLKDLEFTAERSQNTANDSDSSPKQGGVLSKQIFVVHGHDNEMKQAVARTLEKLDLEPIILHEQADQGKTIIEKFLANADKSSFAVVLLSPDDMAYPSSESAEEARPRARQNVILEMGFFIGKLGRDRVVMLYREDDDFEFPSDISGVIYKPYDGDSGNWRAELVKELKACGYAVDANKLYQ